MTRWHELAPGTVVAVDGVSWTVVEVRPLVEGDWDDDDHRHRSALELACHPDRVLAPIVLVVAHDDIEQHLRLNIAFQHHSRPVVLAEHHAVCGACRQLWPCRDHLIDHQVATFAGLLEQSPTATEPNREDRQ